MAAMLSHERPESLRAGSALPPGWIRSARRLPALLGLAAFAIALAPGSAGAQDFELATGAPSFTTARPVEFGFVNVANGNLHLEIPLASPPQRGTLPYVAKLVYDSRIWQVVNNGTSSSWQPTNVANSQAGWTFASTGVGGTVSSSSRDSSCYQGRVLLGVTINFYDFVWTQGGTRRVFPIHTRAVDNCTGTDVSTGNAFATDSSGYRMYVTNYTTATVYAPNGTVVYPSSQGTDPNGNDYTLDPNGNVIDTLGRTPVIITPSCNGNATQTCYDILNSTGNRSRVTVTTESIAVSSAFGKSGVTEYSGNVTVIQSVQLPDGRSYQFTYDSGTAQGHYGELTGITLPTGGQISYTYSNFTDSYGNINQWVASHISGGGTTWFAPAVVTTCAAGATGCQQTVKVTKPSGDDAVYTSTLNNGAWQTQAQYFNGSAASGTLLATTATSWNFSNACATTGCTGNQYIQRLNRTTTLPVSGGSINRTIQYTYDSTQDMNLTQISEWKFYTGSLPASADRVTSITYLTGVPNVINRPTGITVKDGAGNQLAQTTVLYDSTALVSVTGIAHHDDTNYGASYTTRGNPTSIQRWVSGTSYSTTTLTYDTTGQVVSATDPAGHITNLSYADNFFTDTGANPPGSYAPTAPTNAYLTKVTLPITGSTTFGYYWGTGKRAFSTDQNNASTYAHFLDSLDRLTNVYLPAGGWTLTTYASETQTDIYRGIGDASPSTGCVSCRHDERLLNGLGQPVESVLVNDPDGATKVDTGYDLNGRVATIANPYRSTTDPTYGTESLAYDGLDRVLSDTHADNNKATSYYGAAVTTGGGIGTQLCSAATYGTGYPILSVDEVGLKREVWIDGLGRTIETDEPDSTGALNAGTCYLYDALGNLKTVAQGSQTRSYAYDGLSRLTSLTTPEGGTVSYSYDADGNVVSRVAPKPNQTSPSTTVTTTYTYDALNRLTSKSYSDGTTPGVSYFYDQASYNGLTIANGIGRLTGMSDGSGQTAWSYDAAGRILAERRTIAGVTKTISYAYNLDGSLASITYPSGRAVSYSYSNAERAVAAVDANGTNYAKGATFAPQGALGSVAHGQVTGGFAGITESYSYNNRLELASILASSSAGTALNLAYSFAQPAGNNGSVASITNNSDNGRTESFTYDALDRVLTAQAQATSGPDCWGQSFGSGTLADDALGNLLSASVTKCAAPSLSVAVNGANQISSVGFGYDAAGDMTADGQFTYTYDAENRIISSNAGVSYTYDGNSLRVEKSNGTLYWRAFSGDALAETDTAGSTTKEYIYYSGRQIAWLDATGNVFYEFADMLGSTRAVTDSTGNTCFDAEYYPYGQEMDHTSTCPPTNRFTGYEFDSETGNYYAFFRYYSPRLGRFMTADPLGGNVGNPQSLNRYSYVMNNPANATDPLGLKSIMDLRYGGGGGCLSVTCLLEMSMEIQASGIQFGSNFNEFDVLQFAFTPTGTQTVVNPAYTRCMQTGDCGYTPPTIDVPVFGNIGIAEWITGSGGGPQGPAQPPQPPPPQKQPPKPQSQKKPPADCVANAAVGLAKAAHGAEVASIAFLSAGAHFFAAFALVAGGCGDPTPLEPITCLASAFGAGSAFTGGVVTGGIGIFEIAHEVVPGIKQAATCGSAGSEP